MSWTHKSLLLGVQVGNDRGEGAWLISTDHSDSPDESLLDTKNEQHRPPSPPKSSQLKFRVYTLAVTDIFARAEELLRQDNTRRAELQGPTEVHQIDDDDDE